MARKKVKKNTKKPIRQMTTDHGPSTTPTPGNPVFAPYQTGVPWDQQPSIQALWRKTGGPGDKTQYDDPHPEGFYGASDATSFVFGLAEVTSHHWPDIMYIIRPPQEREDYARLAQVNDLRNEHGQVVLEQWPFRGRRRRPLRDLPGIPDQISTKESWWTIELLRRATPTAQMDDILMRMKPDYLPRTVHGDDKVRNTLNMRASRRAYPAFTMVSWHGKGLDGTRPHEARNRILASLSADQTHNGNTRGSTPGLINPSQPDTPQNRIKQPSLPVGALTRKFGGRGNYPRQHEHPGESSHKAFIGREVTPSDRVTRSKANPLKPSVKRRRLYYELSDEDLDYDRDERTPSGLCGDENEGDEAIQVKVEDAIEKPSSRSSRRRPIIPRTTLSEPIDASEYSHIEPSSSRAVIEARRAGVNQVVLPAGYRNLAQEQGPYIPRYRQALVYPWPNDAQPSVNYEPYFSHAYPQTRYWEVPSRLVLPNQRQPTIHPTESMTYLSHTPTFPTSSSTYPTFASTYPNSLSTHPNSPSTYFNSLPTHPSSSSTYPTSSTYATPSTTDHTPSTRYSTPSMLYNNPSLDYPNTSTTYLSHSTPYQFDSAPHHYPPPNYPAPPSGTHLLNPDATLLSHPHQDAQMTAWNPPSTPDVRRRNPRPQPPSFYEPETSDFLPFNDYRSNR